MTCYYFALRWCAKEPVFQVGSAALARRLSWAHRVAVAAEGCPAAVCYARALPCSQHVLACPVARSPTFRRRQARCRAWRRSLCSSRRCLLRRQRAAAAGRLQ